MKLQQRKKTQPKKQQKQQTIANPSAIDFSFKNIRSLNQLLDNMPSGKTSNALSTITGQSLQLKDTSNIGKNTFIATGAQNNKDNNIDGKIQAKGQKNVKNNDKALHNISQAKIQIIRTIQTTDHNYMQTHHKKIINQKQKTQKKAKKIITTPITALFLRYNKIGSIQNFNQLVDPVFPDPVNNLMWVDLSHNRLVEISADLGQLKNLKTLYLHANYIGSFNQILKLKNAVQLITLTIHANPVEEYEEFRVIIHSILSSLKKIDSTLLTKRQTQRAQVLMKTIKKYPVIKNPKKPPTQSQNQEQQDEQ